MRLARLVAESHLLLNTHKLAKSRGTGMSQHSMPVSYRLGHIGPFVLCNPLLQMQMMVDIDKTALRPTGQQHIDCRRNQTCL